MVPEFELERESGTLAKWRPFRGKFRVYILKDFGIHFLDILLLP